MKNIKFRAWHNYRKKMYEVQSIDFFWGLVDLQWWQKDENGEEIHKTFQESINGEVDDDLSNEDIAYNSVFGIELMQYTGREDENDIEIYEGDVISAQGHFSGYGWYDTGEHDYDFADVVKWDKTQLCYTCGGYNLGELDNIRIIGNIYENPNLLDKIE